MRDTGMLILWVAITSFFLLFIFPNIMNFDYIGEPVPQENESITTCVDDCILEGYRDGEIKIDKDIESCWCNDINKTPASLRIR